MARYVAELSEDQQKSIEKEVRTSLAEEGLEGKELDNAVQDALDSKLADLSDTIDIGKYK